MVWQQHPRACGHCGEAPIALGAAQKCKSGASSLRTHCAIVPEGMCTFCLMVLAGRLWMVLPAVFGWSLPSPLDGPCRSHVLAGHLLTVVAGCLLMVLARHLRLSTVDGADDSRSFWRPLYTPAKEQITACCKPLERHWSLTRQNHRAAILTRSSAFLH